MKDEQPSALLLYPFDDFLMKEYHKLQIISLNLQRALGNLEPRSQEYYAVNSALVLINTIVDEIKHLKVVNNANL